MVCLEMTPPKQRKATIVLLVVAVVAVVLAWMSTATLASLTTPITPHRPPVTTLTKVPANFSFLQLKVDPTSFRSIYLTMLDKLIRDFYLTWDNFDLDNQYIVEAYLQILEIKININNYNYYESIKKDHEVSLRTSKLSDSISSKLEIILFKVLMFQEKLTPEIEAPLSPKGVPVYYADSFISAVPPTNRLNDLLLQAFHLKSILSFKRPENFYLQNYLLLWEQTIHEMEMISEELLFSVLPLPVRKSYLLLWSTFIRPIQKFIIPQKNIYLLENQIERLNFSWNSFFQKFSKEKSVISSPNMAIYRQIDTRWNLLIREIIDKQPPTKVPTSPTMPASPTKVKQASQ